MSQITATVALNLTEQILLDYRAALEAAIGALPLRLLNMTWDDAKSVALVEVEYDDDDRELNRQLVERIIGAIEPVVPREAIDELMYPELHDDQLGAFYWDEPMGFEGRPELQPPYDDIPFHLNLANPFEDAEPLLSHARAIAAALAAYDTRWREMIVSELFENYNQNWSQGEPRTPEAFLAEISLSSIQFRPGDNLSCYYGAGDLFLEHDIELNIDSDGRFSAGLIG